MQLVVKYGSTAYGDPVDLVVADFLDDVAVPMAQYPGSTLIPYGGSLDGLERIGEPPEPGQPDSRPRRAPPVDLALYLKMRRYEVEVGGVTVSIGGQAVRVSTARGNDRATLQSTYSAIKSGLRPDGATFNFADGVPRSVSNADMEAACLAAFARVQATFDIEGRVTADIASGKVKTIADINAAFAALT